MSLLPFGELAKNAAAAEDHVFFFFFFSVCVEISGRKGHHVAVADPCTERAQVWHV